MENSHREGEFDGLSDEEEVIEMVEGKQEMVSVPREVLQALGTAVMQLAPFAPKEIAHPIVTVDGQASVGVN